MLTLSLPRLAIAQRGYMKLAFVTPNVIFIVRSKRTAKTSSLPLQSNKDEKYFN